MVLLTLMALTTIGILRLRNLFSVVILSGIYSFLMATVLVVLDAVDVAMTEASVGAGISTVLFLGALALVRSDEVRPMRRPIVPVAVALITGAALIYATADLPPFGVTGTAMHEHVAPRYLNDTVRETTVPNAVTSVLASYRGYDTLGETTVIFTAGIGVLLLLVRGRATERPVKGKRA